jgi:spermidine/putrescine-binding protein
MYRRDFLKASAATAMGLSGLGRSIPSHAAQSMAMLTWGGLWGNGMAQYVDTPFAAKTGYSIIQDRGPTPVERVTKLKIDLLNQPYDLIQIHDGVVPLAESQGVLEPLDLTSPNLQLLKDVPARFRRPGWVAMIYSALGIVYNKEQVKKPPRSFADLWDPEYQGRIVLPQITHSIGPYIIPIGAMAAGKDPKDAQTGFDMLRKMVKLQPVWADDTDTIMNALQSGDAAIGLLYKSQCFTIQDKGRKSGMGISRRRRHLVSRGDRHCEEHKASRAGRAIHQHDDFAAIPGVDGQSVQLRGVESKDACAASAGTSAASAILAGANRKDH